MPGKTLWARRVATDGSLLDSDPITIGTVNDDGVVSAVATVGTDFLTAWIDDVGGNDRQLFIRRIASDGSLPEGAPQMLADLDDSNAYGAKPVGLAAATDRYLLTWQDNGAVDNIFAQRVAADGTKLDTVPMVLETGNNIPDFGTAAAFNGNVFLAAWHGAGPGGISATRITTAGQILDTPPLIIATLLAEPDRPQIVTMGTTFYTVHGVAPAMGPTTLKGSRIADDGSLLDPAGGVDLITGIANADYDFTELSLAAAANSYILIQPALATGTPLLAQRFSDQHVPIDAQPFAVAQSANRQGKGALAYGIGEAMVVFSDFRNGINAELYGLRVSDLGTPIGVPFLVASGATHPHDPQIAFDGTQYLATWIADTAGAESQVHAARISANGTALDSPAIAITTTGEHPGATVASNGNAFMVFFTTGNQEGKRTILATRVNANGMVLDNPPKTVLAQSTSYFRLRAASDGTDYLVGWVDTRGAKEQAYAAGIAADGTITHPDGFAVGDSFPLGGEMAIAAIAYGENIYAISWAEPSGLFDCNIVVRRYAADGTALDPAPLSVMPDTGLSLMSAITHDGDNFVVAWVDNRGSKIGMPAGIKVYASRISSAGVVLDTTPEFFVDYQGVEYHSIAGNGQGQTLFAVNGHDDDSNASTERIRVARFLFTNPTSGQNCTTPADCGGGDCVDGVCCDSICGGGDTTDCQACSIAAGSSTDGICEPLAAATACRASVGDCDVAETCSGASLTCPADGFAADGFSCEDGDACSENDTCLAGSCSAGSAKVCTALDECHDEGSCNATNGLCDNPPKADGAKCSIGSCVGGVCTATMPVDGGIKDAAPKDLGLTDAPPKVDAAGPIVDAAPAEASVPKIDASIVDFKDVPSIDDSGRPYWVDDAGNRHYYSDGVPGGNGGVDTRPGGDGCCSVSGSGDATYGVVGIFLFALFLGRRRRHH